MYILYIIYCIYPNLLFKYIYIYINIYMCICIYIYIYIIYIYFGSSVLHTFPLHTFPYGYDAILPVIFYHHSCLAQSC